MGQSELRIGEVAARTGVSIDTLRYYEKRQLLPRAPRTAGGFRLFSPEAVERIRFIKQAQALGFSLDEVSELLTTGGASLLAGAVGGAHFRGCQSNSLKLLTEN